MKIRAAAKVNFGLRIVGKRKNGYHLIDTVIAPVSLYDEIEIINTSDRSRRITVVCRHRDVPGGPGNIVYRAAALFMAAHGIRSGVRININKQIPVGSGLGGGSADAAATLIGLRRLFDVPTSDERLMRLAVSLGADVPFFIKGHPARARGIGERLKPLSSFPRYPLVILYPGIPISTAWVYGQLGEDLKLTKQTANTSMTAHLRSVGKLGKLLTNDLERVTLAKYPRIGSLKVRLLQEGAAAALMSGSGSAVFGVFGSKRKAQQAFRGLRKEEGVQAFLAHVLTNGIDTIP